MLQPSGTGYGIKFILDILPTYITTRTNRTTGGAKPSFFIMSIAASHVPFCIQGAFRMQRCYAQ